MAWTYFTTDLAPGEIITLDQRNELLDALDERIQAGGNSGDGLHGDMSAVRSSPIITDLVKYTWLGTLRTEQIWTVLGRVCTRYVISDTSTTHYTSSSFTTAVEALVGGSFSAVFTPKLSDAQLWNAARRGIPLLSIIEPAWSGNRTVYTKGSIDDPDWADAASSFLADSESSASSAADLTMSILASESAGDYHVQGTRSLRPINLPAVGPLATWQWWLFGNLVVGDAWVDLAYEVAAGSNVGTGTITQPAGYPSGAGWNIGIKLGPFDGGGTGAMNVAAKPLAYTNSTELATFEPPAGETRRLTWTDVDTIFLAPVFTHP